MAASSRELLLAIAVAAVVILAFAWVTLSTVSAREDLGALERSIESAVEGAVENGAIPTPECDQSGPETYRCVISASAADPAGARAGYTVRLGAEGCWRVVIGNEGLSGVGIRMLNGCVADFR